MYPLEPQTRLHAVKFEFPPGWVCIANTSTDLVICQMDTELKQPLAVVTIRVAEDLHWSISVLDREFSNPEVFSTNWVKLFRPGWALSLQSRIYPLLNLL